MMQILYSAAAEDYVMLFHLDTPGFQYPAVGVARAPNITGPFKFVCLLLQCRHGQQLQHSAHLMPVPMRRKGSSSLMGGTATT